LGIDRLSQAATRSTLMKHLHFVLLLLCTVSASLGQQSLDQSEAVVIEAALASGHFLTKAPVRIVHFASAAATTELVSSDASGMTRTATRQWEVIEIHFPRITTADHMACLLINSKCVALPVGARLDRSKGILSWQVPNAYKGDFDIVFLQPDVGVGKVRVSTGTDVVTKFLVK
jgi:hypothetical protein